MKLPLPRWSLLCGVGLCALLLLTASAAPPAWWSQRGIVNTNATVNDFAPANQGQLKWIATNAYLELEANLPGGAGSNVAALVQSLSVSNNYRPVNLGQLKFVATPFYDRLIETGYATQYPWSGQPNDYALANLGQVKNVFSFDVSVYGGLVAWWKLDEFEGLTATDATGHGHTAMLSETGTAWTNGLSFDGASGLASVTNTPALDTSNKTVSCWINFHTYTGDNAILGNSASMSATGSGFSITLAAEGGIRFQTYDQNSNAVAVVATNAITVDRWYLLTMVLDGTSLIGYIDGTMIGTTNCTGYAASTNGWLLLGYHPELGYANLYLHDVRLYSRAFNTNEVPSLYNTTDTDGDGIPDGFEVLIGSDPLVADADQICNHQWAHGLTNRQVFQNQSVLKADNYCTNLGRAFTENDTTEAPDWWKVKNGYPVTTPGDTVGANGLTLAASFVGGFDPNAKPRPVQNPTFVLAERLWATTNKCGFYGFESETNIPRHVYCRQDLLSICSTCASNGFFVTNLTQITRTPTACNGCQELCSIDCSLQKCASTIATQAVNIEVGWNSDTNSLTWQNILSVPYTKQMLIDLTTERLTNCWDGAGEGMFAYCYVSTNELTCALQRLNFNVSFNSEPGLIYKVFCAKQFIAAGGGSTNYSSIADDIRMGATGATTTTTNNFLLPQPTAEGTNSIVAASFDLRGDVNQGWDPTDGDPWTSVGVGSVNQLVKLKLFASDGAPKPRVRLEFDSNISVSPSNNITSDTDLNITGQTAANPTLVKVRTQPGDILLATLNVMVLPWQTNSVGIYAITDSTSQATSPIEFSAENIITELKDIFAQACVNLYLTNSFTTNMTYDILTDYQNPQHSVMPSNGLCEVPEVLLISPGGSDWLGSVRVFLFKQSGERYPSPCTSSGFARGWTPDVQDANYSVVCTSNSTGYVHLVVAHEIGHQLGLATRNNDDGKSHDKGPAPAGVECLMRSGIRISDCYLRIPNDTWRWLRHEDWSMANEKAKNK